MLAVFAAMVLVLAQSQEEATKECLDFGAEALPDGVAFANASGVRVEHESGHALLVRFEKADWPQVLCRAPEGGWDWSAYSGLAVGLFNPGPQSITAHLRVDNSGADGWHHCNSASIGVAPGEHALLRLRFHRGASETFWGMRGVPGEGPLGEGELLDTAHISAFQVYLGKPNEATELILERAWLFGPPPEAVAMPFIDRFGQYKNASWPGKLANEAELISRAESEAASWTATPSLPARDEYGAWADGPQREATGWFHAEEIDGKWWLVAPNGHLFFSLGMDCVTSSNYTFVEERGPWFEWLPGENEPVFASLHAQVSGAHSWADVIGGKGRIFSFYRANLIRKYGETWETRWTESVFKRLPAWGFNTIANWSDWEVLKKSSMPFVVSGGIGGVRVIEGGVGYWSKMKDVYDPAFAETAEKNAAGLGAAFGANPLCIGYFVDNELAWEGIARGTLESPLDQPCRIALIERLQAKYASIGDLDAAWGMTAESWEALRTPPVPNEAAKADLDAYLDAFAHRYFEVINAALKRHAPNQMYFGCRFSGEPPEAVTRACAEMADMVSFNFYYNYIPKERWTGEKALGKPAIIGEFHFGALDRGMFHTGLRGAANQTGRGEAYAKYVRSVLEHPAFVGCHWFQYVDEPVTGRWLDGENYNIGFLDVTDTPYPELVEAARGVHERAYETRWGSL